MSEVHNAHVEEWSPISPERVAEDLTASTVVTPKMKRLMILLGIGTVAGIAAIIIKFTLYSGQQEKWGYIAALMSFALTVGGGAPMVAVAGMLTKAHWVKPLQRISVLFSLTGVITAGLLLPLLFQLPPLVTEGARRRSIWFEAPDYSPHVWGFLAVLGIMVAGLGLLYSSALPDIAGIRERSQGWRKKVATWMARGWIGTDLQWRSLRLRIGMFGTLYFLMLAFTHFIISTDFSMGLVPGWRDAIYPMQHGVIGLQSGIAAVVLFAWAARRWLGVKDYLLLDQFWSLGRLLLALTLMWVYFWFSGFIVFWYGRSEPDKAFIDLLIRGPMVWAFTASAVLLFIAPWWWLIWNRIRTSINGPAVASVMIIVGVLLDRIRLYVVSWSIPPETIHNPYVQVIPNTVWPDTFDILAIIGTLSFGALLLITATRLLPAVSVWQVQEYNLLARPLKFLRARGVILAKPD